MPGSPTKPTLSLDAQIKDLQSQIIALAAQSKITVKINPDGSVLVNPLLPTGERMKDSTIEQYNTRFYRLSGPLGKLIEQKENIAGDKADYYFQKKVAELQATAIAEKAKQSKLIELLKKNTDLQQLLANGYTKDDILQGLISLKKTLAEIFNSGYEITYGAIKLNYGKFDSTQKADFQTWSESIEGSDKCVKQGIAGLGSKSTCYIKDGKYISKGGRRKRSVRRQYRRSRKVSRK